MNNDLRPINTLPNFKRFCMTIGELPTSYLETMTYYEMLVWFTEYMKNTIIPTINNNGLAVQELQDKYIELKSFVDNYFDNLDVQEEINNKLDEMAESGQLTDIIAQYLGLAGVLSFNTIADMKQATNLVNGSTCKTLGFHEINDGGKATYKIRNNNNDEIDEMTIISLNDNLVAELIHDNEINIKQLGAKGDGITNDSLVIQRAVNKFGGKTILIPSGTYIIEEPIDITSAHTKIKGIGLEKPNLKKIGNKSSNRYIMYNNVLFDYNNYPSIFNLIFPENNNITHIEISNLSLSGETETTRNKYGIVAPHCTYSNFTNLRFNNFKEAILIHGWLDTIEKCSFFQNEYALRGIENYYFVSIRFINCYFNTSILSIRNGVKCTLLGCQSDNGNPCYDIRDSESVTLLSCGTETYSMVLRNTNSNVYIYGGDYEGHSSEGSTFYGFFINQQNGHTYINNAYIHFEDYAEIIPTEKNIVTNTGGIVELLANISTPYKYTNYLTGSNSYTKINNEIYSTTSSILQKRKLTVKAGSKIEIFRLPFDYGKNIQIFLKGYGTFSHTSVVLDSVITAVSTTSTGVETNKDIDINDRTIISSKDIDTITASITAEQDTTTNELVIYFNCSQNYIYNLYCDIEFNNII